MHAARSGLARWWRWDVLVAALWVGMLVLTVLTKGGLLTGKEQNVFRILRASFTHLAEGRDLYAPDPARHADIFLYSPTFALLFAPFALLPYAPALVLWDALNLGVLWWGIGRVVEPRAATAVRALVLLEALRTTQHSQSNALVAGLILLTFASAERRRQAGTALAAALGFFVKVFPLGAAAFAVFHPRRGRQALLVLVALVGLTLLPLLVVSPASWVDQHRSWLHRLTEGLHAQETEQELPTGPGLYGGVAEQLRFVVGRAVPNLAVTALGLVLLLAPLLRGPPLWASSAFRRAFLASFLVFCVIFNHESESPSFVIAVTGVALWWAARPRSPWRVALLVVTLLVVSVAATEVVPKQVQEEVFYRWRLKTLPCLLAWIAMQVDLWTQRARPREEVAPQPA